MLFFMTCSYRHINARFVVQNILSDSEWIRESVFAGYNSFVGIDMGWPDNYVKWCILSCEICLILNSFIFESRFTIETDLEYVQKSFRRKEIEGSLNHKIIFDRGWIPQDPPPGRCLWTTLAAPPPPWPPAHWWPIDLNFSQYPCTGHKMSQGRKKSWPDRNSIPGPPAYRLSILQSELPGYKVVLWHDQGGQ